MEIYLSELHTRDYRRLFFMLRTGELSLRINTGRWGRLLRQDRICEYCSLNVVEDEFHFLLICPLYTDIRLHYLPRYYHNHSTLVTFYDLLSTTNTFVITNC